MKIQLALLTMLVAVSGCGLPFKHNIPPAEQLMHPGPGVDGPGPGVMTYTVPPPPVSPTTAQVAFVGPEGMMVSWDAYSPGRFDSEPLVVPGRFNFIQAAIFRLKLTNIPGRAGVELYPTLEIAPATPRTDAYLAHNPIPFQLTEEDFDQVLTGNFVTKVIYLPDPQYQELALAGVETLVSTRLDPGVDPIVEADRRGTIMAIIRIGNIDLEMPGQAAGADMVAQGPGGMPIPAGYCGPGCGPGGMPGAPGMMGPPPGMLAGVTAPQYGMPITGTPIGLPGPPHVPLGVPAGLQKHVMKNHTFHHIPEPVDKLKIHVKQKPGFVYPKPPHKAYITEHARPPLFPLSPPIADGHQAVNTNPQACPPGGAVISDGGP